MNWAKVQEILREYGLDVPSLVTKKESWYRSNSDLFHFYLKSGRSKNRNVIQNCTSAISSVQCAQ